MPKTPATRTSKAAPSAPAVSKPAARPSSSRPAAGAKSRLAGKPAVRLPAARAKGKGKAPAPESPAQAAAAADPRLQDALDKVRLNAKRTKDHRPASEKSQEARDAAGEQFKEKSRLSRAQESQVEKIKEAEGQPPEEKSFLETLEEEIEKVMPKTIKDADSFMNKKDQDKFKGAMTGNIEQQKEGMTAGMRGAAQKPPDPTKVARTEDDEYKPLPAEALPAAATVPVGARNAMPPPRPDPEVSLQSSKDEVEREMADNKITDPQLAKANDPRFSAVLEAKAEVNRNADEAPQRYREGEMKTLATAASRAAGAERRGMAGMAEARGREGGEVKTRQTAAQQREEKRREWVAGEVEKIYGETKGNVEKKLSTLEADVTRIFDANLKIAIDHMKEETQRKKSEWKRDRYYTGPIFNAVLWGYDKFKGIDHQPRIKQIYVEAAEEFTKDMKFIVRLLAGLVERRLKEAREEVERGRARIHTFVAALPEDLKGYGEEAEKAISDRFDELKQSIEDKKQDLAMSIAQRYKEAHDKAAEAIKEMQAEDKGLVKAFLDKLPRSSKSSATSSGGSCPCCARRRAPSTSSSPTPSASSKTCSRPSSAASASSSTASGSTSRPASWSGSSARWRRWG